MRCARGAKFPARLDALYVGQILYSRIHNFSQFRDSVDKIFHSYDDFSDEYCNVFEREPDDDLYDCQHHLARHLLQLIESRLNQLRGDPGSDASHEAATLKHAKRQLILPNILAPAYNYGTVDDVPALIDNLCTSNDFGTAYSALQTYARPFSGQDYILKHGKIFTSLALRVANLPVVLGVDIPKDVLDYPIIFQKGVWSKVLGFSAIDASNITPYFVHQDCTKSTILHSLAEDGEDIDSCTLWGGILADIDLNQQDFVGRTALHIAAEQKSTSLVARLIANRADLELTTVFGHTPLHYTASLGCTKACDVLLEAGANANATDVCGGTPIYYAAAHGHETTVKTFLDWPETDLRIDYVPRSCPLYAALVYKQESVALAIMSRTNWKKRVSKCSYLGTALHLAVICDSLKVASMVIKEMGRKANTVVEDMSALSLAIEEGNFKMVQLILAHPDVDAGLVDKWNRTPLHIAAIYGRLEIATALAAREDCQLFKRVGTPPYTSSRIDGMTAYELAMDGKHLKLAEMLSTFMSLSDK